MSKRLLAVLLTLALVLGITGGISAQEQNSEADIPNSTLSNEGEAMVYDEENYENEFVPGQVIVGLKNSAKASRSSSDLFPGVDVVEIKYLTGGAGIARASGSGGEPTLLLTLGSGDRQSVLDAIEILKENEAVSYAEPNYIYYFDDEPDAFATGTAVALAEGLYPDDPRYSELWGLEKIQAPLAWEITTGDPSVLVGILDSGGTLGHEDLAANSDPALAKNCYDGSSHVTDLHSHGTHVAGTVGAVGNNGVGVTGVCWDVTLVPMKIAYGANSTIDSAAIVTAVDYATAIHAPIINMSFGGGAYSQAFQNALTAYPGLAVCAAGNSNQNLDVSTYYPPSYRGDHILPVGNSTESDSKAGTSSYGKTTVDLFAPGTSTLSTIPTGYGTKSGTSMASPHVAGAAALLLSYDSSLTALELKEALMAGVDEVGVLANYCISGGRLNVYKSLQYIMQTEPQPDTYTITFDANGGVGAPGPQIKSHGEPLTLTINQPTRRGYSFSGWSTYPSYTTQYRSGSTFAIDADTTLYAVWYPLADSSMDGYMGIGNGCFGSGVIMFPDQDAWFLEYSSHGGELSSIGIYDPTGNLEFEAYEMIISDHQAESVDGVLYETSDGYRYINTYLVRRYYIRVSYKDDKPFEPTPFHVFMDAEYVGPPPLPELPEIPDVTEFTITYDANGGINAPDAQIKIFGDALILTSDQPTKTGYTFQGWSHSPTATSAMYRAGGTFISNADTTLYAVWK